MDVGVMMSCSDTELDVHRGSPLRRQCRRSELEHHAAIDPPLLHLAEDVVDALELVG